MTRFLVRHRFTIAAIVLAVVMAVGELIWVRARRPSWAHVAVVSVLALGVIGVLLAAMLWLSLSLRRPMRNLRYRWLTRDVDQRMRAARK